MSLPVAARRLIDLLLSFPLAAQLIAAGSAATLVFAFIMQYGFGYAPCILCLAQRGPYAVATLAALTAWLGASRPERRAALLYLCAAAFVVGAGLAVFHTGVEQHWWLGTSGCAIQPLNGTSPDALRQSLLDTVLPRCDVISWTLFGLSMANWNVPTSMALAVFAALAGWRVRRS